MKNRNFLAFYLHNSNIFRNFAVDFEIHKSYKQYGRTKTTNISPTYSR